MPIKAFGEYTGWSDIEENQVVDCLSNLENTQAEYQVVDCLSKPLENTQAGLI